MNPPCGFVAYGSWRAFTYNCVDGGKKPSRSVGADAEIEDIGAGCGGYGDGSGRCSAAGRGVEAILASLQCVNGYSKEAGTDSFGFEGYGCAGIGPDELPHALYFPMKVSRSGFLTSSFRHQLQNRIADFGLLEADHLVGREIERPIFFAKAGNHHVIRKPSFHQGEYASTVRLCGFEAVVAG
jgi:hypothetical protein